jgi:hypothetical protein
VFAVRRGCPALSETAVEAHPAIIGFALGTALMLKAKTPTDLIVTIGVDTEKRRQRNPKYCAI